MIKFFAVEIKATHQRPVSASFRIQRHIRALDFRQLSDAPAFFLILQHAYQRTWCDLQVRLSLRLQSGRSKLQAIAINHYGVAIGQLSLDDFGADFSHNGCQ